MADQPWWAAAIASGVAAVAAGWGSYERWRSGKDKRDRDEDDERAKARAGLDARSLAWIDRVEADNARLRKREADLEADLDRCQGFTRAWFNRAHETYHAFAGVLTAANHRLERAGLDPVPVTVPGLSVEIERPDAPAPTPERILT